ncbi:unnamed protein product [Penicillium olsonii]|uniref:F-box domain-containing protein n=1 Tax=Penicillium olsonii TaxID=99116 RepID=A0A9W4MT41_PENOL|nr:unnamed protein product [Penicillium olsonii]
MMNLNDQYFTQAEPNLEGLPTELKIHILWQIPVIEDLKSLVLASPGYHRAYLLVRYHLLEWHANQQLGEELDLAEALTAVRSKGIQFTTRRESAIALLDTWRRRDEIRGSSQSHQLPYRLDKPTHLEGIINLLHFQKRILRALCRLQILKNIFGDPIHCFQYPNCDSCSCTDHWRKREGTKKVRRSHEPRNHQDDEYAFRLFYGTMPPWEYEEMGCVYSYFREKDELLGKEIGRDLRQLSESTPCEFYSDILPVEERPPPGSTIHSDISFILFPDQDAEGLAGLGPEFLYRLFHVDRLTRRNIVCRNTRKIWHGPFIGYKISLSWEYRFPLIEPADRHDRPGFEQFWSSLPAIEQPTPEWKRTWLVEQGEDIELEYAIYADETEETGWNWCYALWDEERLEEWKSRREKEISRSTPGARRFIVSETGNITIEPPE